MKITFEDGTTVDEVDLVAEFAATLARLEAKLDVLLTSQAEAMALKMGVDFDNVLKGMEKQIADSSNKKMESILSRLTGGKYPEEVK